MPTYEYVCDACGARFERFQKMSDRPVKKCPECGEKKVKRLLGTGGGIIFRGSGFYETDYKRKGPPSGSGGGSSSGSEKSPTKSGD